MTTEDDNNSTLNVHKKAQRKYTNSEEIWSNKVIDKNHHIKHIKSYLS